MESQTIKNSQIFGGSAFNNDHSKYGSHNARLHDSLGYRADPSVDLLSNVLGIDLKGYMIITAVATQGFGDPRVSEWVRSYHVFYNNTVGQRRPVENIDGKALVRKKKIKDKISYFFFPRPLFWFASESKRKAKKLLTFLLYVLGLSRQHR